MPTLYRSANIIIQNILEEIIASVGATDFYKQGILKSHLIKNCGLKTNTAEKYFSKLEKAGYITSTVDNWGEREVIVYQVTQKGRDRYEWFVKINTELE